MFKRSMVSDASFAELPPIGEATGFYYGLGVGSFDYAGVQVIEKGGALAGVRTVINLVPELNSGAIVVLANLNLTTFPEAVRAFWINQQLGIDPNTDQQQILDINEQLKRFLDPPVPPSEPRPVQRTAELAGRNLREPALRALQALRLTARPFRWPAVRPTIRRRCDTGTMGGSCCSSLGRRLDLMPLPLRSAPTAQLIV